MGEFVGGRVWRLRRGLVLGDGKGDGGVADGGADHVADALDREGGTGGLGELIILLEATTWSATEIEIRIDTCSYRRMQFGQGLERDGWFIRCEGIAL